MSRTTKIAVVGSLSIYAKYKITQWCEQARGSENEQLGEYESGWEIVEDQRDAQRALYDGNTQHSDEHDGQCHGRE